MDSPAAHDDQAASMHGRSPGGLGGPAVLVLLAVLIAWISVHALQRAPSFDGAMNLQVSWSLAEGEGYRRTYADRPVFPLEIQTNVPFTLPAAAVFKVFGMGIAQAQIINLLYLFGLAAMGFLLLRRAFGTVAGGAGALLLLVTPGVMRFGLNGYGEVPALFWALAALSAFPWARTTFPASRVALAGACLGLALATKTVMVIGCAVFGVGIVVAILAARGTPVRRKLLLAAIAAGASAIPLVAIEVWRAIALGGIEPYLDSRAAELGEIFLQAGSAPISHGTQSLASKFAAHAALLSEMYGLSAPYLILWLAGPFVFAPVLAVSRRARRDNGVLACLLVAVAIYFAWWLLLSPTEKAWHRRILDGSLLLNLSWVYLAALALQGGRTAGHAVARAMAWTPVGYCVLLAIHFFSVDLRPTLSLQPDTEELDEAVAVLKALPQDARIFGLGWQSAPVLSLLSRRPFEDLNDTVIAEIGQGKAYLVVDQATIASRNHERVIRNYRAIPLLPPSSKSQVYAVDFANPIQPAYSHAADESYPAAVDFAHSGAAFAGGFFQAERSGRWMSSDAVMDLEYDGKPVFAIDLYTPAPSQYIRPDGIAVFVTANGCPLGRASFNAAALHRLRLPIPTQCALRTGQRVRVRISTNNLIDNPITRDDRALAAVLLKAGFVPDCGKRPKCNEWKNLEIDSDASVSVASQPDKTERMRSAATLEALPDSFEHCRGSGPAPSTTIHWNTGASTIRNIQIWISAPGQPRKLWLAHASPTGSKETGSWVQDRMQFYLVDSSGRLLDSTQVRATCRS